MRVIGGLRFDLALGAARLGTADRGHARGRCRGRRHECLGGRLRLRSGIAVGTPGMAWLELTVARFALTVTRLAFTARLAGAAGAFPRTFL